MSGYYRKPVKDFRKRVLVPIQPIEEMQKQNALNARERFT
jgi:hypothetical protein